MVRFNEAALQDADGSIKACLAPFGTVDKYLTSVQEHLPYLQQGQTDAAQDGTASVGQRAHTAVLQQLDPRTPTFSSGQALLAAVQATRLMPCGVDSIDAIMIGGLRETTVTEIAGETCSGKTQLCHLAAVTTAQRGERVVYFDTTNSFCAARVQQLCDQSNTPQAVQGTMANITVVYCHSIHALLSSLDELAHLAVGTAPNTMMPNSPCPKLVVVDSISALLSPIIGASQHNQGHVLVAETTRLLRHTAESLQCSVLVTNHVVGSGGTFMQGAGREDSSSAAGGSSSRSAPGGVNLLGFKPALGEQWRGAAHVRLQLSRGGGDVITATLLTHSIRPPGAQARFSIGAAISSVA